jgi:hypothetical protein
VPGVEVTVGWQFRRAVQLILEEYFLHDASLSSRPASGDEKRRAPKRRKSRRVKAERKTRRKRRGHPQRSPTPRARRSRKSPRPRMETRVRAAAGAGGRKSGMTVDRESRIPMTHRRDCERWSGGGAPPPGDGIEIGGNDRRLATRQCDGLEDPAPNVNNSITPNFYEDPITNAGAVAIRPDSQNRACPHSAP